MSNPIQNDKTLPLLSEGSRNQISTEDTQDTMDKMDKSEETDETDKTDKMDKFNKNVGEQYEKDASGSDDIYFDENLMFLVENGGNTCYIDALLMALFYTESHIDAILTKPPSQDSYVYLQEYIKSCFVDQVRSSKNVTIESINELRYILMNCGWLNADDLFSQQDVNEFFTFLVDKFDVTMIELIKQTFTDTDGKDNSTIEKLPFIPLSLPYNSELQICTEERINVKDMLHEWLYKNEVSVQRNLKNVISDVTGLSVYHIHNIPEFVALWINRFPTINKRLYVDVIIQKKLMPFKHTGNPEIQDIEWCFHAAVCHRGDTLKSGHYYSLLFKKKNGKDIWYIFDDMQQPCLMEVNMTDKVITNQIKNECVFLLYQLKLS